MDLLLLHEGDPAYSRKGRGGLAVEGWDAAQVVVERPGAGAAGAERRGAVRRPVDQRSTTRRQRKTAFPGRRDAAAILQRDDIGDPAGCRLPYDDPPALGAARRHQIAAGIGRD